VLLSVCPSFSLSIGEGAGEVKELDQYGKERSLDWTGGKKWIMEGRQEVSEKLRGQRERAGKKV